MVTPRRRAESERRRPEAVAVVGGSALMARRLGVVVVALPDGVSAWGVRRGARWWLFVAIFRLLLSPLGV